MTLTRAERINAFISSLIFVILIPNIPILWVWSFDKLELKDVLLAAAAYPISLFVSAKYSALFSGGVFLSLLFASAYGVVKTSNIELKQADETWMFSAAVICIISVSVVHAIERVDIHLYAGQKFFNFS